MITDPGTYKTKFKELKACVIIPTYNNSSTLSSVIADVANYCNDIIVVNDGSTDATEKILQQTQNIRLLSYEKNIGKGWALRKGFAYASSLGYRFAITIDSDGQHFAEDLPVFLEKLEQVKNAIIIGARNMDQASVPGKSSFGHKFSNFWFKVETGITAPDTQSGYRAYPLDLLKDTKFLTRKYEFEIEVLVRAAWKGVKIDSVPVSVYYAPKETRISHFRPFTDFSRISVLNTVLVILTFVYIKPRDFFRLFLKKNFHKELIREHLFNANQSDELKAVSIAFGVFMGIIPIWGFQLAAAIGLSILFKLNRALVIIAANISIPPMIPLILFLSFKMGSFWMKDVTDIKYDNKLSIKAIGANLEQYIYGSITLAIVAGLVFGLIAFVLMKLFKRRTLETA